MLVANKKIYNALLSVFIFLLFFYTISNILSVYNLFDDAKIYQTTLAIKDVKNYIWYANTIIALFSLIISLSIFSLDVFFVFLEKNESQNSKSKELINIFLNPFFIFSLFLMLGGLAWSPLFIFGIFIWLTMLEYHLFNFIFSFHAEHPAFYFFATYIPATFIVQLFISMKIKDCRITRSDMIAYGILYFFIFSSFITNLIWIGEGFWGLKFLRIYSLIK